jgi:hypothetical protein
MRRVAAVVGAFGAFCGRTMCAVGLLAVGGLVLVGCGDDDDDAVAEASTSTSTIESTTSVTATPIDTDAPLARAYETTIFRPALSLSVPEDWEAVERDEGAFQAYRGSEEYLLTFDHTYLQSETVDEAIARLEGTPGLTVTGSFERTVGGQPGKGFEATTEGPVEFADSGFHTPGAGSIEVIAVPVADGTTVTIFLVSFPDSVGGYEPMKAIGHRILDTVEWR